MSTEIQVKARTYLSPAFVLRRFVDILVQLLEWLVPEQTETAVALAGGQQDQFPQTEEGGPESGAHTSHHLSDSPAP